MRVIVTGGAGFIGSHLVDVLIARGDYVTVIDDFSSGSKSNLSVSDRLEVIEFRLDENIPPQIRRERFDAIVHLAGLPSVASSWTEALAAHSRNLTTTLSLIDACSHLQIPRFVFASSAAVYGLPTALPIPETSPCEPLSPYGLQKLTSEKYLNLFSQQTGLAGISLRLFNVYGPRQDPRSAYSGVISIFADAIRKKLPLTIFGDGSQTRDFVFVADVVHAICGALSLEMAAGDSLTFNIGTGRRCSLLDVVQALAQVLESDAPQIDYAPPRSGDIPHSQPDIGAAFRHFGFAPRYSLIEGLRELIPGS